MATNERIVTVFGGTGFLGRRIVLLSARADFPVRIEVAAGDSGSGLPSCLVVDDPQLQSWEPTFTTSGRVADSLEGVYGAVNAVSLYVERGPGDFYIVHVEGAERVAAQAHRAGVARLVQARESAPSPIIIALHPEARRRRAAVRAAFEAALLSARL